MKTLSQSIAIALTTLALLASTCLAAPTNTVSESSGETLLGRLFPTNNDFSQLKERRRKINNEILQLDLDVTQMDARLERLKSENEEEDWEGSAERIGDLLPKLAERMKSTTPEKEPSEAERFEFRLLSSTASCEQIHSVPDSFSKDHATTLFSTCSDRKKKLEENIKLISDLGNSIIEKKGKIASLREELITVEERISKTLDISTQQYLYTFFISLIYAAIVFFLMHKFFTVIGNQPELKKTIFSGDAGIQFITLFSIVIAVILFGVLGILKSNELSALLGGLSGYILGRSSSKEVKATPAANGAKV